MKYITVGRLERFLTIFLPIAWSILLLVWNVLVLVSFTYIVVYAYPYYLSGRHRP